MKMNVIQNATQSKKSKKLEGNRFIDWYFYYFFNRVEISPEADQHKKHKSSVSPSHERPARIKSVIQKKDATSDIHKPHNLRRK